MGFGYCKVMVPVEQNTCALRLTQMIKHICCFLGRVFDLQCIVLEMKEDCQLVMTRFYSLRLFPHSNIMIKHGLSAIVRGLLV